MEKHKIGKLDGYYVPNLFSVICNRWLSKNTFGESMFEYASKVESRFNRMFGTPDIHPNWKK